MAQNKKPKKPKIKVGSIRTPEQAKKADDRIAAYKKRLAAWNKAKSDKKNNKGRVKAAKERIARTLAGL
jgi:hypothetical protein